MKATVLIAIGTVVGILGAILWWGNMSGTFPTFNYAGYIVGGIGGMIGAAGYRKMHAEKLAEQQQRQQLRA